MLVVGHNPGLHELAARLAVTGDTSQITRLHGDFPTAALAVFSFPGDAFKDLTQKTATSRPLSRPRTALDALRVKAAG